MGNQVHEEDKYYSLDRVVSISATASTFSWFFLVFAILLLSPLVYTIATAGPSLSGSLLSVVFGALSQIALSLVFIFFFIFLRAISEVLYLLVEIEEGINPQSPDS
ncbi:MAG TPA: hypothetical protein VJK02_22650 [Anaerolineales bacterium]|jgi:hypothetical protein|nr:hypothetical protein [Anaerolineales bacterium]